MNQLKIRWTIWHRAISFLVLAATVIASSELLAQQAAPQQKPVLIVSFASVDSLVGDASHLAELVGFDENSLQMVLSFLNGIDKTRPFGAVLNLEVIVPAPLIFIPVEDFKAALATVEVFLGKPEDAGNGVWEISGPNEQTLYVKEQGGWAFVALSADALQMVPENPVTMLEGLEQKYDIAIRGNIQNIAPAIRQMAIAKLQESVQAPLELIEDGDERDQQRQISEDSIGQLETVFNELESFTMGFNIDPDTEQVSFDVGIMAVEGTKMAEKMSAMEETTSDFSGFLLPEAAATFHVVSLIADDDKNQFVAMVDSYRKRALSELDDDTSLPDKDTRDGVKEVMNILFDVVLSTIRGGRLNVGGALLLGQESLTLTAGGFVADGSQLDSGFRKLIEMAMDQTEVQEVKFDVETYEGVRFHTFQMPVLDEEARAVLGDHVEVVVGIGEKSGYIAAGADNLNLIKRVIESSAAKSQEKVIPFQGQISLGSIANFVASVNDNPAAALFASAFEDAEGNDRITIQNIPEPRGSISRIIVDESIIKAIGVTLLAQ